MQRLELTDSHELKIYCPFCGTLARSPEGLFNCEHTLYHASDYGFEYLNSKLNFDKDIELEDKTIDEFTDEIEYPNAIKFAIYNPPPSFFGGYVGFADK